MSETKDKFSYDCPALPNPAPGGTKSRAALFPYTERHLKCVWFDPDFRPHELRAERGDRVIVERPGNWNLEKGPDFLDAVLLVGPERRRIAGDVEIHIHPADWQRHNHARDPAYARVIAHITFFAGQVPPETLPPGTLQIALRDSLAGNPFFSFEALDLTAYPFVSHKSGTPCSKIILRWSPEQITGLLESAGRHRLERKAERLAGVVDEKDADQVLYEEIMSSLGYKHNRMPFRHLAELVPLEILRNDSGLNATAAYAILAGVAGLLPSVTDSRWDDETRRFIRRLWNYWWKQQAKWSARIMPKEAWVLSSVRPQNHPRRRLMAAAILFTGKEKLGSRIFGLNPENARQWLDRVMEILQCPADAYWRRRFAVGRKPYCTDIALVGRRRAAAIVSNVVVPFQLALHPQLVPANSLLKCLPPEEDNAVIRQSAFNLLGPDHNPSLYRNGLCQQGLIQIFHDCCLGDRSDCAECGLVKAIVNPDKKEDVYLFCQSK